MQLEIELTSLQKETDEASARAPRGDRARAGRAERALGRDEGAVGKREAGDPGRQRPQGAPGGGPPGGRAGRARRRPAARRRTALRGDPRAGTADRRARIGRSERDRRATEPGVPQRGGRGRRRRRGGGALDGDPGEPPAGGGSREADPHGGAPARARRRPGRGDRGGRQRAAPLARRPAGPRPPDRHVPVPRPDRRRQDRAGEGARRVHVRLAGRDDPDRHVGVHGEAHGLAPGRRPPGYVGYEEGGQLTEAVRRRPYTWCCWTRSRRRTPTCSTRCCR